MIHLGIVDVGEVGLRATELVLHRVAAQLQAQYVIDVVQEPEQLSHCDRIVIAAQGSFLALSRALSAGLGEAVRDSASAGTPLLAISLGMQVLFDSVQDGCTSPGLGIISGTSVPLTPSVDPLARTHAPVPHIGWNRIMLERPNCPVLSAVGGHGPWAYFSHSLQAIPHDPSLVSATVDHGSNTIVAAISNNNVVATQFRPDRSGRAGIRLLVAFLEQPRLPRDVLPQ